MRSLETGPAARWHVSSYSGSGNNCLEHGRLTNGTHAVRDTKARDRAVLALTPAAWQSFVDAVRNDALAVSGGLASPT